MSPWPVFAILWLLVLVAWGYAVWDFHRSYRALIRRSKDADKR